MFSLYYLNMNWTAGSNLRSPEIPPWRSRHQHSIINLRDRHP
ncbi:MAG TPA: hypothetical protein VK211_00615 [Kamptonema sp.]|nr:hypothetical protein [Kamptonema sp.]